MSPWEDRHVRELVDELDRLDRIPSDVADRARSALEEGRYREALNVVLSESRGDERREEGGRPTGQFENELRKPSERESQRSNENEPKRTNENESTDAGSASSIGDGETGSDGPLGDGGLPESPTADGD